jgi:pyridoxine 5'-phosphate synthase PdxJ
MRQDARGREAALRKVADAARHGRNWGSASTPDTASATPTCTRSSALPELEELNIGHSIVRARRLVGMERAVREMAELLRRR